MQTIDEYDLITFSQWAEYEYPTTAYAIYGKSGFYKTWKFVWIPDVYIQNGIELEYASWKFYNDFPGFEILKLRKTDAKSHH